MDKHENATTQSPDDKTLKESEFIIQQRPIMPCALDVLSKLGDLKKITLKARGESIPNAVAIANIITEKMLKGNSQITEILVDSEYMDGKYGNTLVSTIKINIIKN